MTHHPAPPPDRAFIARNTVERERLRALVARLTKRELQLPLGEGWTVAAALAHLAFWDRRVLALLEHWQQHGVTPSPYDADVFNAALLPLCLAIPSHRAAQLAVESAEAVDRQIAHLTDEMLTAIRALAQPPRLERALHRREHLGTSSRRSHRDARAGQRSSPWGDVVSTRVQQSDCMADASHAGWWRLAGTATTTATRLPWGANPRRVSWRTPQDARPW